MLCVGACCVMYVVLGCVVVVFGLCTLCSVLEYRVVLCVCAMNCVDMFYVVVCLRH